MNIGTLFTGYTALSSTTETLLGGANLKLPAEAKEIVGIVPYVTSPAGNTANEPVAAYVSIISDDLRINPLYRLCEPIGASLLKSVAQVQGKSEFMEINCPCNGGEELKIYGAGLFNHTIEPYAAVLVVISNVRSSKKQRFSKLSTFTNTGVAATTVSGGTVTITGGSRIVSLGAMGTGTTVATLKGLVGHMEFSGEFVPPWIPQKVPIEPASGQVDTNIQEAIAGVGRKKVAIDIKAHCVVTCAFNLAVALTTTGNFVGEIVYE